MIRTPSNRRRGVGLLYLTFVGFLLASAACRAQITVDITLPGTISFTAMNITQSATGSPDPCVVEYSAYNGGGTLKISIQAGSAYFTRPGGAGWEIPASNVSWTASGGGSSSGTLSSSSFTQMYSGTAVASSFSLTWHLAALDASVRAGLHTITATWKIESL